MRAVASVSSKDSFVGSVSWLRRGAWDGCGGSWNGLASGIWGFNLHPASSPWRIYAGGRPNGATSHENHGD